LIASIGYMANQQAIPYLFLGFKMAKVEPKSSSFRLRPFSELSIQ